MCLAMFCLFGLSSDYVHFVKIHQAVYLSNVYLSACILLHVNKNFKYKIKGPGFLVKPQLASVTIKTLLGCKMDLRFLMMTTFEKVAS